MKNHRQKERELVNQRNIPKNSFSYAYLQFSTFILKDAVLLFESVLSVPLKIILWLTQLLH